jgi:hypothetical protein
MSRWPSSGGFIRQKFLRSQERFTFQVQCGDFRQQELLFHGNAVADDINHARFYQFHSTLSSRGRKNNNSLMPNFYV